MHLLVLLINFTHVQGVSFDVVSDVAARSAVPNTDCKQKKICNNRRFGDALLFHESSLFTSRIETTEKTETPKTAIRTPHLARLLLLVLLRT
jgi:hypothetical protein